MNLLKLRKNKKGFTLVELLIVIVILGIIAALVLPKLLSQPEKARVAEAANILGIMSRTLSSNEQLRPGQWPNISGATYDQATMGNQLGLAAQPDTTNWHFSSPSVGNVIATRQNVNNPPNTGVPGALGNCNGETITLSSGGAFTGSGCYAVGGQVDIKNILS